MSKNGNNLKEIFKSNLSIGGWNSNYFDHNLKFGLQVFFT